MNTEASSAGEACQSRPLIDDNHASGTAERGNKENEKGIERIQKHPDAERGVPSKGGANLHTEKNSRIALCPLANVEGSFDKDKHHWRDLVSITPREYGDRERTRLLSLQRRIHNEACLKRNHPSSLQKALDMSSNCCPEWIGTHAGFPRDDSPNSKACERSVDDKSVMRAMLNTSEKSKFGRKKATRPEDKLEITGCDQKMICRGYKPPIIGASVDVIIGKMDSTDASEVTMDDVITTSCRVATRKNSNVVNIASTQASQGVNDNKGGEHSAYNSEWEKVPLPAGWVMKTASKSNRPYYVHVGYGSTWSHPLQPVSISKNSQVPLSLQKNSTAFSYQEQRVDQEWQMSNIVIESKCVPQVNENGERPSVIAFDDVRAIRSGKNLLERDIWIHPACSLQKLGHTDEEFCGIKEDTLERKLRLTRKQKIIWFHMECSLQKFGDAKSDRSVVETRSFHE